MKRFDLKPSKEPHCNFSLKGYGEIPDLPCTRLSYVDGIDAVASTWRVPFWQRIKFLFDGRIHAVVYGKTHAPLAVTIGELLSYD